MATQKRRIIYFNDQEWEIVKNGAARQRQTISAFVRYTVHLAELERAEEIEAQGRPMTQAQRDAILRRINKGG